MADPFESFRNRAKSVETRHRKLAEGYVTRVGENGLLQHKPRRRLRLFRPRLILYPVLAILLTKAFFLAYLGVESYEARLVTLSQGTVVERGGAVIMAIDPVTRAVAGAFGGFASL